MLWNILEIYKNVAIYFYNLLKEIIIYSNNIRLIMNNYNVLSVDQVKKVSNQTKFTLQFSKKNKTTISKEEIRALLRGLENKYHNKELMTCVRGLNNANKWSMLKNPKEKLLLFDKRDDYWEKIVGGNDDEHADNIIKKASGIFCIQITIYVSEVKNLINIANNKNKNT
jgi:hypothetical protein